MLSRYSDRSSLVRARQSFWPMLNSLVPGLAGKTSTAQSASRSFFQASWAVFSLAMNSLACALLAPNWVFTRSCRLSKFSSSSFTAVSRLYTEHSRVCLSSSTPSQGVASGFAAACAPVANRARARKIVFIGVSRFSDVGNSRPTRRQRTVIKRRRQMHAVALCRFLTLSAIPLSFLHPARPTLRHMLAPKRRQTFRRVINLEGTA